MEMKKETVVRFARPTNRLEELAAMYAKGLGFEILSSFENHDGFDGVILGVPEGYYHLEFTRHINKKINWAPTKDHLLVFYLPNYEEWKEQCLLMIAAGFKEVPSFNPFWDKVGKTFVDIDGYRVVLENEAWLK